MTLDPSAGGGEVRRNDRVVALDDLGAMLDSKNGKGVVELARAQRDIVAHGPALGDRVFVRCDPTDAKAGQSEWLRNRADADSQATVVEDRWGQGFAAGHRQPPVGFVAQDARSDGFG